MEGKGFSRPLQRNNSLPQIPSRLVEIDVDAVEEAALLDGHDLDLVEDLVDVEGVGYHLVNLLRPLLEHRLVSLIQNQLTELG